MPPLTNKFATAQPKPPLNDVAIDAANSPTDSVSKLEFNPVADFLAVSSWDSQVRVYEYSSGTGQTMPKAAVQHDGPALGVAWSKDGTKLFTCSTDKSAKMLDLAAGGAPAQQVAAHDAPISCLRYLDMPNGSGQGVLVTAGWDKMVKYWDLRQANPIAQIQASERVYCMDAMDDLLVFGTAERQISLVNLKNPSAIWEKRESPLKMQTRVIKCFPKGNGPGPGYALGSVEGRVGVQYTPDTPKVNEENFSFKCHRGDGGVNTKTNHYDTPAYPVNAVCFNNKYGTFATAGADGTISFWDKVNRSRLASYTCQQLRNDTNPPTPIVAIDFSRDTELFAYAFSYDWHRGHQGATPSMMTKIMLHKVVQEEVLPKKK